MAVYLISKAYTQRRGQRIGERIFARIEHGQIHVERDIRRASSWDSIAEGTRDVTPEAGWSFWEAS